MFSTHNKAEYEPAQSGKWNGNAFTFVKPFAKANICAAKISSTTLSFKNVGAVLKFSAKPAGETKVTVPMDGLKNDYIVSFGATPSLTLVEADHPTTINLGSGTGAAVKVRRL